MAESVPRIVWAWIKELLKLKSSTKNLRAESLPSKKALLHKVLTKISAKFFFS